MSNSNDSAHGTNVANFEDLISYVTSYGGSYNPSVPGITLTQLGIMQANGSQAHNTAITSKAAAKDTERNRKLTFNELNVLSSKLIAALQACGTNAAILKAARAIDAKIKGRTKLTKADAGKQKTNTNETNSENPEAQTKTKKHSTRQTTFDNKVDHLANYISLLGTVPGYNPNETELQISTLNAFHGTLKNANTSVIATKTNYSNALINRDEILYKDITGLVDIALAVKSYVKSVYGPKSPQYKQVAKLQFKKYKK
ncbi:MAG: hypothetical protein K0S32_3486 [Bacteroidetes bacterium]|jgi:hypothetical protein|nr:hypothetical protein [Bacteroidota bacterium]